MRNPEYDCKDKKMVQLPKGISKKKWWDIIFSKIENHCEAENLSIIPELKAEDVLPIHYHHVEEISGISGFPDHLPLEKVVYIPKIKLFILSCNVNPVQTKNGFTVI